MSDPFAMSRALENDLPGYDRAIDSLDIDDATRAALHAAVIAGHEYTDPGRQLPKVVGPVLAGTPWRWPLFEEWRERFSASGDYPYMWKDVMRFADDEDELIDLFCHYLSHCATSHAQWLRIHEAAAERPFLRLSLIPEPEVVASWELAAWTAADLSAAHAPTPLYPGCRASLQQLSARDMERFGYSVGEQVRELPAAAPPPAPVQPEPEPKRGFFGRLFNS